MIWLAHSLLLAARSKNKLPGLEAKSKDSRSWCFNNQKRNQDFHGTSLKFRTQARFSAQDTVESYFIFQGLSTECDSEKSDLRLEVIKSFNQAMKKQFRVTCRRPSAVEPDPSPRTSPPPQAS